jgi:hypothetical protein
MAKFEINWGTGNEICVNCAEKIGYEMFVRLEQNRWAKPCICKVCLKELLDIINGKLIEQKPKKKIVYDVNSVSKNSWMTNF